MTEVSIIPAEVVDFREEARGCVQLAKAEKHAQLRTLRTINATLWRLLPRPDGVVPFGMERIADDVEAFHLGLADLDPLFIGARVERTLDLHPVLVVVAPISSTTARRSVSGRPRQFWVIGQNSRCSILFHCVLQKHE